MIAENEKLVSWLFETNAVKVCPENKPFWYTSGTIGPYFINSQFLYGSEEKANDLLKVIDSTKSSILECPAKVLELTLENYKVDSIYKGLIDGMCQLIKENININDIDYISGGERRDWLFSLVIAKLLNKPHITIYKDLKTVLSDDNEVKEVSHLEDMRVLHVADLINEASSYERAWIPAIMNLGAHMKWSVVVVDRNQGGSSLLESQGVKSLNMFSVDKSLFEKALKMGIINEEQFTMIINYLEHPKESMREFLICHSEFLENSLNGDGKSSQRARLCVEKDLYELNK